MTTGTIRYALVGPGKAGRSLVGALENTNWQLQQIYASTDDPADAAGDVNVVVVAVPDDRIADVAAAIRPGPAVLLHLSGAKGLDVLSPHAARASAHPLMSLPDPVIGAVRLRQGIVFAVAGHEVSGLLVAALGGTAVTVDDNHRAAYHATAAIASNHLVALCAQVERLAGDVGVPVDAYWDLMATTLDNIRSTSALSSLTGPASRGDVRTLASHLDALPMTEHELYTTLAREAARLAGRSLPDHGFGS